MIAESHLRSFTKAISYRAFSTLFTASLVWAFTRKLELALMVGGFDLLSKTVLFYLHERIWDHSSFGRREIVPPVIWFTGLSGSGKTTLAKRLVKRIQDRGFKVELIDGDEIRRLVPSTGFTKKDRNDHVTRMGLLARYLQRNGVAVVASVISPYEESREYCRQLCPNFIEVYLSTPFSECEKRDPKGLYAKARRGEISDFTGLDSPYEPPKFPELVLNTTEQNIEDSLNEIVIQLKEIMGRNKLWIT